MFFDPWYTEFNNDQLTFDEIEDDISITGNNFDDDDFDDDLINSENTQFDSVYADQYSIDDDY